MRADRRSRSSSVLSRALIAALLCLVSLVAIPFAPAAGTGSVRAQAECDYPSETLQLMAPAAPGGGWDTTAREIQQVLQGGIVDQTVEVFNVEGAGGTIGLAQLVSDNAGDPHTLMVMGMVMIGAIATNQSAVTLDNVTPLASLTAEYEVIVVPADSEYQTLQDLIDDLVADPGSVTWAGGSAGGTDHILVGLIAQAVGADPTQINYVPYSGGGEALAAILGGQVSAGVSGIGEWQDQIASGELRALAISGAAASSATPAAGTPAASSPAIPTLKEQGVDVELANWRGIVAPPEISTEQRDCIVVMLQEMHASQGWQNALAKYGWQDYFQAGDAFAQFLPTERDRITAILQQLGLVAA
jgi:putative tricarboxylic transport membrane protein